MIEDVLNLKKKKKKVVIDLFNYLNLVLNLYLALFDY